MGQNSIQDHQSGLSARRTDSRRLDSWKEIASYLHRDARTVRRWERERRLPVHRVPGGERSGVFAYVSELDQWLGAAEGTAVSLRAAAFSESAIHAVRPANVVAAQMPAGALAADTLPEEESGGGNAADADEFDSKAVASPCASLLPSPDGAENSAFAADHPARSSPPEWQPPWQTDPLPFPLPLATVVPARLERDASRGAFHGMAILLILAVAAVAGGSGYAFVHYRKFHQPVVVDPHPSREAKELYLRGRYSWNLRTEDGLNQAVDLFTQSIVNDPHYAPAYAGLADAYLLLRQYGHMPDSEAYPRALASARQAISLDASCPDAHRSLAFIFRFWNWDMPAAEREYLRAIALDPKNSQSHHWYATALLSSGRVKEALVQIDLARELEPQSVSVLADRGLILSFQDPASGAEALKQLAQSQPEFASTHAYLANIDLDLGGYAGFLAESRIAATLNHDSAKVAALDRAKQDLLTHGPLPMLRNLASGYAVLAERGQGSAYSTARLFGLAGDRSQAIRYLQMACDRRDPGFLSVEHDAAFRDVRSSPQYLTLLARRDARPDGWRQPIARLDRIVPL